MPANANSAASIRPVGPPPPMTTACSVITATPPPPEPPAMQAPTAHYGRQWATPAWSYRSGLDVLREVELDPDLANGFELGLEPVSVGLFAFEDAREELAGAVVTVL